MAATNVSIIGTSYPVPWVTHCLFAQVGFVDVSRGHCSLFKFSLFLLASGFPLSVSALAPVFTCWLDRPSNVLLVRTCPDIHPFLVIYALVYIHPNHLRARLWSSCRLFPSVLRIALSAFTLLTYSTNQCERARVDAGGNVYSI